MIWTHCFQRLDDRCLGLFNSWITVGVDVASGVGASPVTLPLRPPPDTSTSSNHFTSLRPVIN